ncbi:unnamed protein product [Closterium sp. NIES-54]
MMLLLHVIPPLPLPPSSASSCLARFPDLGLFATVSDLTTQLRSLEASYRAACTEAQLLVAPLPMWLTVLWVSVTAADWQKRGKGGKKGGKGGGGGGGGGGGTGRGSGGGGGSGPPGGGSSGGGSGPTGPLAGGVAPSGGAGTQQQQPQQQQPQQGQQ